MAEAQARLLFPMQEAEQSTGELFPPPDLESLSTPPVFCRRSCCGMRSNALAKSSHWHQSWKTRSSRQAWTFGSAILRTASDRASFRGQTIKSRKDFRAFCCMSWTYVTALSWKRTASILFRSKNIWHCDIVLPLPQIQRAPPAGLMCSPG